MIQKRGLRCFALAVMSILLAACLLPVRTAAAPDSPPEQVVHAGSEVKPENGNDILKMEQRAEAVTENGEPRENLFDVTATVTTSEDIRKLPGSANASVVLLMDVSGSMNVYRSASARKAALAFVDNFVKGLQDEQGTTREIALAVFGDAALMVEPWTDVSDEAGVARIKASINQYVNTYEYHKKYTCAQLQSIDCDTSGNPMPHHHGRYVVDSSKAIPGFTVDTTTHPSGCAIAYTSGHAHLTAHTDSNTYNSGRAKVEPGNSTNIAGGLLLSKNLLKLLTAQNPGEAKNLYTVMMTDGDPTATMFPENYDYESTVFVDAEYVRHAEGVREEDGYKQFFVDAIQYQADAIKAMNAHLFTVNFGADLTQMPPSGGYGTVGAMLRQFSTRYFSADDEQGLIDAFGSMSQIINLSAKAWKATIPMGPQVEFVGMEQGSRGGEILNERDGVIHWDLKKDFPLQDVSPFTYEVKYRVRLKTDTPDFEAGKAYHINSNDTSEPKKPQGVHPRMTYLIVKAGENVDESALKTGFFDIPTVMGFKGAFAFSKVSSQGGALEGAKFQIASAGPDLAPNGVLEFDAESGQDGAVLFGNLPSGQEYILKEVDAPEKHILSDIQYHLRVSFGKVIPVRLGPAVEPGADPLLTNQEWINQHEGSISFHVPPTLHFGEHKLPLRPVSLQRRETEWRITVNNTTGSDDWKIFAQPIPHFKNTEDDVGRLSSESLCIVDQNNEEIPLSATSAVNVLTLKDTEDLTGGEYKSLWGTDLSTGPRMDVAPDKGLTSGAYETTILWTLQVTP